MTESSILNMTVTYNHKKMEFAVIITLYIFALNLIKKFIYLFIVAAVHINIIYISLFRPYLELLLRKGLIL